MKVLALGLACLLLVGHAAHAARHGRLQVCAIWMLRHAQAHNMPLEEAQDACRCPTNFQRPVFDFFLLFPTPQAYQPHLGTDQRQLLDALLPGLAAAAAPGETHAPLPLAPSRASLVLEAEGLWPCSVRRPLHAHVHAQLTCGCLPPSAMQPLRGVPAGALPGAPAGAALPPLCCSPLLPTGLLSWPVGYVCIPKAGLQLPGSAAAMAGAVLHCLRGRCAALRGSCAAANSAHQASDRSILVVQEWQPDTLEFDWPSNPTEYSELADNVLHT